MSHRTAVALRMGFREFRRTPVLVVLLAVLPAYFIGAFVLLVPETDIPVSIGDVTATVSMPAFAAAFMTAASVAIVSGIIGLFLVLYSKAADDRLRLAGFSATELVVARIGALAAGVTVASTVAIGVSSLIFEPANRLAFAAVVGLLGLTYGVVGVIAGLVFDELGGVYVMLLVPLVDVLLFQNPLASDVPQWADYLPGQYATAAVFETAFTAGVDLTLITGSVGYAVGLVALSITVFHAMTRVTT